MPDAWSDDRVNPLIDELKSLEERRENAEAAKGAAEARMAKIKSDTRVKDRHRWLALWANGDTEVSGRYRLLREEIKHREQQVEHVPQARQTIIAKLDQVIADDLTRNNPAYEEVESRLREHQRKRNACNVALTAVLGMREKIVSVSASLYAEPKGKAALTASTRKQSELSAQLKAVRDSVRAVNNAVGSGGMIGSSLVNKLNPTLLSDESSPDKRKNQLDNVAKALGDVAHKIKVSSKKFAKRVNELERDRAQMVKARRNQILSTHGLGA